MVASSGPFIMAFQFSLARPSPFCKFERDAENFEIMNSVSFLGLSKEEGRRWVLPFPAHSLLLSWPQRHGDLEENESSGFSASTVFSFSGCSPEGYESLLLGRGGTGFAGSHNQAPEGMNQPSRPVKPETAQVTCWVPASPS